MLKYVRTRKSGRIYNWTDTGAGAKRRSRSLKSQRTVVSSALNVLNSGKYEIYGSGVDEETLWERLDDMEQVMREELERLETKINAR